MDGNKYTCHIVDYVTLEHKADVVEFILSEFCDELFGQNIHGELVAVLFLPQICKLMRIGIETQTRKHRFKHKRCFSGARAVAWLMAAGFADDATELATQCAQKGLVRSIQTGASCQSFKNEEGAFYTLDPHEIDLEPGAG